MTNNKLNKTHNDKKEDGKFKKINIKHGQAESTRSVFNSRDHKDIEDLD